MYLYGMLIFLNFLLLNIISIRTVDALSICDLHIVVFEMCDCA